MGKTLVFITISVIALLIVIGLVVALVDPHTRFIHMNEYCVYYDGLEQCAVPKYYCNEDGSNNMVDLGGCGELIESGVATPLDDGIETTVIESTGACPIVVTEGDLVQVEWISSDPDEDIGPQGYLSYEYEGILTEDGTWQTSRGDAGIHSATARVYDGEFWDETDLCIEVLKLNNAAELTVDSDDVTVYETETVEIKANCVDPDGDETFLTYTGWMDSSTRETGYNDAGEYDVNVNCVDEYNEGAAVDVKVTVLNKNRPPQISWKQAEE